MEVAHELGHNFYGRHGNVTHGYADHWWDGWQDGEQIWWYTIMWDTLYDNNDYHRMYAHFSNGNQGNTTSDNQKWMIPYACEHLPKD